MFLRLLEYYKGVMFLTTNRVSAFDAAFQSRIHLTINYLPEAGRSIQNTYLANLCQAQERLYAICKRY